MSSRAKALHLEMLTELQRETEPEDYSQIKTLAKRFLGAGVIYRCSNILELLHQLERCGALGVGDYKNLKEILDGAKLIELLKIVGDREGKILQTKEGTPTASSQAPVSEPEAIDQAGAAASTYRQAAESKSGARSETRNQSYFRGANVSVTGNSNVFGSVTYTDGGRKSDHAS